MVEFFARTSGSANSRSHGPTGRGSCRCRLSNVTVYDKYIQIRYLKIAPNGQKSQKKQSSEKSVSSLYLPQISIKLKTVFWDLNLWSYTMFPRACLAIYSVLCRRINCPYVMTICLHKGCLFLVMAALLRKHWPRNPPPLPHPPPSLLVRNQNPQKGSPPQHPETIP